MLILQLGYITADSASSNKAMSRHLSTMMPSWDEEKLLHCCGHAIARAVNDFLSKIGGNATMDEEELLSWYRRVESGETTMDELETSNTPVIVKAG